MTKPEEQATRRSILDLFKRRGPLTVSQLIEETGLSESAVRFNITLLERDGYIQSGRTQQPAGRPARAYRLTEAGDKVFPSHYDTLLYGFLHDLEQVAGAELVDRLFCRRNASLLRKYDRAFANAGGMGEKLDLLAGIQNEGGYMVKWSRRDEAQYEFVEHHCPIARIADRYEQACRSELELFESLLSADVSRTECLARGGRRCVYTVRPRLRQHGD